MSHPFEEPAKSDLRGRSEIAIDQAGQQLVTELVSLELPSDLQLQGRLKGDLQSLDGEGYRYCYFLRPKPGDALPKWLANLAVASRHMQLVKVYVVVEEASASFERSCKAAGAGLLRVTEDNEFEHVLDFDSILPEALDAELAQSLDQLRREMETKLELHTAALKDRFQKIGELTSGMSEKLAEEYSKSTERQYRAWTDWSEKISRDLDAALAGRDREAVEHIRRELDAGPVLEDDVEGDEVQS